MTFKLKGEGMIKNQLSHMTDIVRIVNQLIILQWRMNFVS